MPFDYHKEATGYFKMLLANSEKSIIPFAKNYFKNQSFDSLHILELGCGEGGNLIPFAQQGAKCIGIDLNATKIAEGNEILKTMLPNGNMTLRADNIFNEDIITEFKNQFDLIILKDVIEHIPNKDKALAQMRDFLKPNGVIFVGWPPWYMPFGGHQQMCKSKLLRVGIWLHLLPKPIYVSILKLMGERDAMIEELAELVDYRVTINQMKRLAKQVKLNIVEEKYYFINPIYEYKFGFKTRETPVFIQHIPYLRDFVTTSAYYLLGK